MRSHALCRYVLSICGKQTGPFSEMQHPRIHQWLASQGIPQDGGVGAGDRGVTMCSNPRASALLLRVLDRESLREAVWRRCHDQPADNKSILGV